MKEPEDHQESKNQSKAQESSDSPRLALLACDVFEKEIAHHSTSEANIVETRYFEMGLHDRPDILRSTLQGEIDQLDSRTDIDAIVLAYGLCGCGTAGLHSKNHRIVIPRGHDCITVFLGSKERYAEHQSACPGCMYYTPGWNQGRRVPGPDKLKELKSEFLEKFDEDDVEFLLESEQAAWSMHDTATYIDLGTDDAEKEANYAQDCAKWLKWDFQRLQGEPTLLKDLLHGRWDQQRFQFIEPGEQLAHSPDAEVMRVEPVQEKQA